MITNLTVANTILEQLGGNRFRTMTGASALVGSNIGLTFKLPSRFANNGINYVRITLDATDTYTVEFVRLRGTKITIVDSVSNVYADNLQAVFTSATGLAVRL
jgi:MoaA/NifB/PqqE/SkfB family radical SAM enzyme